MSRLDFLYRTELPHRAIAVYIYLADRVNENGNRNILTDFHNSMYLYKSP